MPRSLAPARAAARTVHLLAAAAQAGRRAAQDPDRRSVHRAAHRPGPRLSRFSTWSSAAAKSTIVKRRTDWFQVRTDRGVEGWAPREQMIATLEPTGEPLDLQEPARENYMSRRWQAGVMAGDFAGASLISVFGGYAFSDNLSIELTLNHILGEFSNGYSATLGLMHVFVPEWRLSPYFTLGTGVIYTEPKSTLVQVRSIATTRSAMSAAACSSISPAVSCCARNTATTSSSRAATTTRKWTNGSISASPSFSDRARRGDAAGLRLVRPRRRRRAAEAVPRRPRREPVTGEPSEQARSSIRRSSAARSSARSIDTEDFELGAYVGMLSIEDFESNVVYGARLAYHLTEDFFLEGDARPVARRPHQLREPVRLRRPADRRRARLHVLRAVGGLERVAGRSLHRQESRVQHRVLPGGRHRQHHASPATIASR